MFSITDKKKFLPFLLGIVLLFVGLTLSKALTSLATVYFLVLFIFQKNKRETWNDLKENKTLRWFFFFIGWMILSLLWSSGKINGLKMLGSNLNFIAWPILMVCFSSFLFANKKIILTLFSLIVTGVSIFQFIYFQGKTCFPDIREMALFVSHIRFALMVDIAFFIAIASMLKSKEIIYKIVWILIALWLLFYTYYSQVLSGVLVLIGGTIGIVIYVVYQHPSRKIKYLTLISFLVLIVSSILIFEEVNKTTIEKIPAILPVKTALGNLYEHKKHTNITENGYYLDLYYCEKEVESAWSERAKLTLNDYNPKGYQYKYVIKRYLTSKGLRKDAEGMNQLTQKDIENIKNGISSVVEFETGLLARYKQMKYELSGNLNPNGHSILQRFEFWKASKYIIQKNIFFGVGLGGSKIAFQDAYQNLNSKLLPENQWESHNQFLIIWVNFGLIGLILFMCWISSIFYNVLKSSGLYLSIFCLLLFSFLVEDTLGTLTGMTLFAFFAGFFQNQLPLKQG